MIKKIQKENMGGSNLGWLKSIFHFSFGEYYDSKNMNFGVLRVLNDDLVNPRTGFDLHPHHEMEIISYVIQGELTHGDSMGNKKVLTRGDVQYMSAGTGVLHSEHNFGDKVLRFIQIWITPDGKEHNPCYGEKRFDWELRKNRWLKIVSGTNGDAPIRINQDSNIYVLELEEGKEISFPVSLNRQAYLVQIEGESVINDISMYTRDALEIVDEKITIKSSEKSHFILIEMSQ